MTSKQLAILNSLVTFAAENVPGGLSEEESEVAKIVGAAVMLSGMTYQTVPEAEAPHYRYVPCFVGHSTDGEKIAIYRLEQDPFQLFITRNDGRLLALNPSAQVTRWHDDDDKEHIRVQSLQWSGEAIGTRAELIEQGGIYE